MSTAVAPLSGLSELPAAAQAFEALVRGRRAMPGFRDEPVPQEIVDRALRFAAEAPSGYNLQPWRFLVLRTPERRARLREAAFGQAKITEAPLVVVATAPRDAWRDRAEEIFKTQAARTGRDLSDPGKLEKLKASAFQFIDGLPREVWLTRQVMIGFTYLMLAFESLGWQTAPMEGFDAGAVRKALQLPPDTEVVALLAVGRGADSAVLHPGRLGTDRIAYDEHYGTPWIDPDHTSGNPAHPPGAVS